MRHLPLFIIAAGLQCAAAWNLPSPRQRLPPLRDVERSAPAPDSLTQVEAAFWGDLPLDFEKGKGLDPSVRREILKYGELTQATYDAFEKTPYSDRFGVTFWTPAYLLGNVTQHCYPATQNYGIRPQTNLSGDAAWEANYIYADSAYFQKISYDRIMETKVGKFLGRWLGLDFITATFTALLVNHVTPEPWAGWLAWGGVVLAARVYQWTQARMKALSKADLALVDKLNLGLKIPEPDPTSWIGYIAVSGNGGQKGNDLDVVVAFRGTILRSEWVMNILGDMLLNHTAQCTLKKKDPNLKVHEGFKDMLFEKAPKTNTAPIMAVMARLEALVTSERPGRVKTITFVGHSLGGALATIAAGYLGMQIANKDDKAGWSDIKVRACTFCAPRVGNDAFRKRLVDYKVPVLNVVNFWDVVPVAPGVLNALAGNIAHFFNPKIDRGTVRVRFNLWSYVNSGDELLFNSRECDRFRRLAPWDFGPKHNLEGLLHMVATQHVADGDEPETRDVALINKSDNLLNEKLARAMGIPAQWWNPVTNSHLKLLKAERDGKVTGLLYRHYDNAETMQTGNMVVG